MGNKEALIGDDEELLPDRPGHNPREEILQPGFALWSLEHVHVLRKAVFPCAF